MNVHDAEQVSPPFKLFLAAGIVAAIAAIPLIWVVKDSDRLRRDLIARKAEEEEADATPEEERAASDAE